MTQALEELDLPQPARQGLRAFFEQSSRYLIGSESSGDALDPELAADWHVQLSLDDAVAAVRAGDVDRALSLADPACGPSRFAALLGIMLAAGNPPLVRYVRDRVASDPALARERFNGRTLLHAAAAAGDADTLDLLLRLGGDPGAHDGGGHTPLYSVANECSAGGGAVVHLLARAGASLDAADGVKRATPLHMAARRGSVEIAAALLDCGARIEARDSLGETPLRRAVNCGKVEVARLLLERGADPDSLGSKRLTPRLAARTGAMRQLLREASPR
jgi:Ankyrin repeats (3 copies)/Ankyrin repeat